MWDPLFSDQLFSFRSIRLRKSISGIALAQEVESVSLGILSLGKGLTAAHSFLSPRTRTRNQSLSITKEGIRSQPEQRIEDSKPWLTLLKADRA